jgi:hypothetical protein
MLLWYQPKTRSLEKSKKIHEDLETQGDHNKSKGSQTFGQSDSKVAQVARSIRAIGNTHGAAGMKKQPIQLQ